MFRVFRIFRGEFSPFFQRPYRRANAYKHWSKSTFQAVPYSLPGTAQKLTKPLQTLAWHDGTAEIPCRGGGSSSSTPFVVSVTCSIPCIPLCGFAPCCLLIFRV